MSTIRIYIQPVAACWMAVAAILYIASSCETCNTPGRVTAMCTVDMLGLIMTTSMAAVHLGTRGYNWHAFVRRRPFLVRYMLQYSVIAFLAGYGVVVLSTVLFMQKPLQWWAYLSHVLGYMVTVFDCMTIYNELRDEVASVFVSPSQPI